MKLAAVIACVGLLALVSLKPASAMSVPDAIHRVFGHGAGAKRARCIAKAESGLNRWKISPTDDYGAFQIHGPAWFGKVITFGRRRMRVSRRYIFRPLDNARAAWIISKGGSDWSPWTTAWRCS